MWKHERLRNPQYIVLKYLSTVYIEAVKKTGQIMCNKQSHFQSQEEDRVNNKP